MTTPYEDMLVIETCPCGGSRWDDAAVRYMWRCGGCGLLAPVNPSQGLDQAVWYDGILETELRGADRYGAG